MALRPWADERGVWRPPALATSVVAVLPPGRWPVIESRRIRKSAAPAIEQHAPVALPRVDVQIGMSEALATMPNGTCYLVIRRDVRQYAKDVICCIDIKGHIVLPRREGAIVVLHVV